MRPFELRVARRRGLRKPSVVVTAVAAILLPGSIAQAGGPAGVVTTYADPSIDAPWGIVAGSDGALWFTTSGRVARITTAKSVVTSPTQGQTGTPLAIAGSGFGASEPVVMKYVTGLSSPAAVTLCTTASAGDGTFACSAIVPTGAGGTGTHTIKAKGTASGTKAKTIFLRTT